MIRHYECGILFLPSLHSPNTIFLPSLPSPPPSLSSPSFAPTFSVGEGEGGEKGKGEGKGERKGEGKGEGLVISFPLSFSFPPKPYSGLEEGEAPWVWDRNYVFPDDYGNYWPPRE